VSRLVASARAEKFNLEFTENFSANEMKSALRAITMSEKMRVIAVAKASVTDERVECRMCRPTEGGQPSSGHIVGTHSEGLKGR